MSEDNRNIFLNSCYLVCVGFSCLNHLPFDEYLMFKSFFNWWVYHVELICHLMSLTRQMCACTCVSIYCTCLCMFCRRLCTDFQCMFEWRWFCSAPWSLCCSNICKYLVIVGSLCVPAVFCEVTWQSQKHYHQRIATWRNLPTY